MATKDRLGNLHDEKNGQFTSKESTSKSNNFKIRKEKFKAIFDKIKDNREKDNSLLDEFNEDIKESSSKIVIKSDPVTKRLPENALTKKEWAQWYHAVGEIKRGMKYPTYSKGVMIQIDKKIVLTEATYLKPIAKECTSFNSTEELDDYVMKKIMED